MKCSEVREFLPWFANGSLSAAEIEEVKRHLADCAECRDELSETGATFKIFDQHLSAETLIELAFEGSTESSVATLHLDSCEICTGRLTLVRESHAELGRVESEAAATESSGQPLPRDDLSVARVPAAVAMASPTPWRSLAMAASLAAMVTTAGWIWSWQAGAPSPASTFRGAESVATGSDAKSAPLLNVAVVEVSPTGIAGVQGADRDAVRVPMEASAATLLLESDLIGDAPVTCRLTSADGAVIWTRDGLERRPEGGYALSVPTAGLAAGRYVLSLLDREGYELESYSIELR